MNSVMEYIKYLEELIPEKDSLKLVKSEAEKFYKTHSLDECVHMGHELYQSNNFQIQEVGVFLLGYAAHEKDTLERVINARNGAIGAKTIDEKIVAENALSSALSGLKITLEAYPDLKANQNFLQLQEEIADLENKLSSVRRYFNSATKEYNNAVETFPSNILAGMFGFRKEVMFDLGEQRAALEEAPKIKF